MTGPEHYCEAQDLLDTARRASDRGRDEDAAFWQREAQVHATLALAAATALNGFSVEGSPQADRQAWYEAASEGPAEKQRVREAREAQMAEFAADGAR